MRRLAAWTTYWAMLAAMATALVWLIMRKSEGHALFVFVFALLFMAICTPRSRTERIP